MREVWETPYGNAVLKIERANKHISDIEKRLLAPEYAYHLSLGIHADTGKQFLYYSLAEKYIRASLALMIGDAIHNLKCALDIAWCEVYRTLYPKDFNPKFLNFPFYPKREYLETALTEKGKIPAKSSLFELVVNGVKSYKTGDADIWAVHRLDIHDKHQLLIPVLNVLSIDGVELEQENGQIDVLTLALTGPITDRIEVPFGSKLKNYGHATFEVKFRDGIPAEGLEVIPALKRFSWKVKRIVRTLQRMR